MEAFFSTCLKLYLYILLFFSTGLQAQRAETNVLYSNAKVLIVELESIDQLELNSTDSENVFRVISNDIDDTNVPKVYAENNIVYVKVASNLNKIEGSNKSKYRAGQPLFPKYIIQVPENISAKVFYTKGNFISRGFRGDLDLHIQNYGKVEINKFSGTINIEIFSGIVDCAVSHSIVNIETSKGSVQSFLKDKRLIKTTTSLKGVYESSNNTLNIKTINAKVVLKPFKNQ